MKAMKLCAFAVCLQAAFAAARADQAQTQPAAVPEPAPATAAVPQKFDPSKSDEKAVAIVDKVIAAMGGDAWAKAHFVKFTWVMKRPDRRVAITHYWDRFAERSRMEGPSREGKAVVAVVDHKTKSGQATLDGQPLTGEEAKKYTDIAYGRLINDSYWVFMPFKLKDPGVRLRYDGEVKAGPVTYDKVLVSFDDGIGLTSKDKYWLYVNRSSNMIESWSYVLQDMGSSASPVAWEWTDWSDVAGMKLSMRKTQRDGDLEIVLENVEVLESLPEDVFTSTAPVGPAQPPAAG